MNYGGNKMTSVQFIFWLQGFFEISECDETTPQEISAEQVACIKKHLKLVFKHEIDPSYPDKDVLDKIHNPKPDVPAKPGPYASMHDPYALIRC